MIMTSINAAAHVNPVNLLSTALLASRKHALDESDLEKTLALLKSIIAMNDYSERITITPMSPREIIDYGIELGIVERHTHQLGSIIRTDANRSVLMNYFCNKTSNMIVE